MGLSGLLGRTIPSNVTCDDALLHHSSTSNLNSNALLMVSISSHNGQGTEGFTLIGAPRFSIIANTASGGLYGAFRFLSLLQQHKKIPVSNLTSSPSMRLRAWDLWDNAQGIVEQGHDGNSLFWPYALYDEKKPPPRNKLYVSSRCNATDPFQQWEGLGAGAGAGAGAGEQQQGAAVRNVGSDLCLTSMSCDPVSVGMCSGPSSARWIYNATNHTLALAGAGSVASGSCGKGAGTCLDLNEGKGPDLDLWSCHGLDNLDYVNQRFVYNETTRAIHPEGKGAGSTQQCLTLGRSAPLPDAKDDKEENPWSPKSPSFYQHRVRDLLRFLKSSGINTLVLNDVNACGAANAMLLDTPYLTNWTTNLGPLFERYAMTPMISLCFAAPTQMSNVTSDPLDPLAIRWWENKIGEIYAQLPSFGGVVVKADSEGNVGPMSFNRTESDGANMLARVLRKHASANDRAVDSLVLWRAFIYGDGLGVDPHKMDKIGQEDLARQSYDTFKPLDGQFEDNVVLQIKNGPMDFQVREPPHPLLGGMPKTNIMMEVSANQGYTGHQIHVVNLAEQWSHYLQWDTMWGRDGTGKGKLTIGDLLTGKEHGGTSRWGGGMACTSNIGNFRNYTGHVLAAANTYACGRLAWDPTLAAEEVDREWALMTFPSLHAVDGENSAKSEKSEKSENEKSNNVVVETVVNILHASWLVYEGYSSPMGIGFIIGQDNPYGCAPKTNRSKGGGEGPNGTVCPKFHAHDWPTYWPHPCDDYDFANYSKDGLGCDRTSAGVGSRMTDTYSPGVKTLLDNPETCPSELLLFFHNKRWMDPIIPYGGSGDEKKVSLFDRIRDRHESALVELKGMAASWNDLEEVMLAQGDNERFYGVQARFLQQENDAAVFAEDVMSYYRNLSGLV